MYSGQTVEIAHGKQQQAQIIYGMVLRRLDNHSFLYYP